MLALDAAELAFDANNTYLQFTEQHGRRARAQALRAIAMLTPESQWQLKMCAPPAPCPDVTIYLCYIASSTASPWPNSGPRRHRQG